MIKTVGCFYLLLCYLDRAIITLWGVYPTPPINAPLGVASDALHRTKI